MFAVVGILVVFAAVIGGFLMEHGPLRVLMQPAELLIIGGAAIGTLLAANPMHTLTGILKGMKVVIAGSKFNKKRYLEALQMMYSLFNRIRRQGLAAVENDIEKPQESKFFAGYPAFLKDHETCDFVCDTMRLAIMGGVEPFDVDQMIESDMDVHSHELSQPVAALSTMADALPGLGIVAAVLGVVLTMSALGGPRKRSAGRLPPRWWVRFSASCCVTDVSDRWPRIWASWRTRSANTGMSCGWR